MPLYPWAAEQPRWAMQAALEAVLAGTMTPGEALKQAQEETADWLAQQGPGKLRTAMGAGPAGSAPIVDRAQGLSGLFAAASSGTASSSRRSYS